MISERKGYKGFLTVYGIWLLVAIPVVFLKDKYAIHLLLNAVHSDLLDNLFRVITFFGDGLFVTLIAVLLLFYNYWSALLVGIAGILSGVFSQLLKRQVFPDMNRPIEHLDQMPDLYIVPLLDMKHMFSFPSGHSTAAFALFFSLSLLVQKKRCGLLFAVIAMIIGYSRIYLSQHFLEDVLAGSLLGVVCGLISLFLMSKAKGEWTQRSLRELFA